MQPSSESNFTTRVNWLTVPLLVVSLLSMMGLVGLQVAGCNTLYIPGRVPATAYGLIMVPLLGLAFAVIGFLIIYFRPGNLVGWISLLGGTAITLGMVTGSAGLCGVSEQLAIDGGLYISWFGDVILQAGVATIFVFLPLYFPTGRALSPNWQRFGQLVLFFLVIVAILRAFLPGELQASMIVSEVPVVNPLAIDIEFLRGREQVVRNLLSNIEVVIYLLAIFSLLLRWRRSSGDTRQQLKWFAFFLATAGLLFMSVEFFGTSFYPAIFDGWFYLAELSLFWLGYPIVIGLIVFKYRLYDIDLIIRRTLIYGVLSAGLILIYFGSVTALQSTVTAVSGQQSPLVIVISTLVIAALFNPLRRRVQTLIDRRFYRSKYDAAQTLNRFAQTAREEVELEVLTAELVQVVRDTMQPESVSLWLAEHNQSGVEDRR